jgi:hypothetical protein
MGPYYKLINTTKREQVSSWKIGSVAKFFEWLYNNQARILVWLLRKSDEGGGGDIPDWTTYQTLGRPRSRAADSFDTPLGFAMVDPVTSSRAYTASPLTYLERRTYESHGTIDAYERRIAGNHQHL